VDDTNVLENPVVCTFKEDVHKNGVVACLRISVLAHQIIQHGIQEQKDV
jgi:hypothetical protein